MPHLVGICRSASGDYSMNGVSNRCSWAYVFMPDEPAPDAEWMAARQARGYAILRLRVGPYGSLNAKPEGEKRWCMFGGNLLHSSDQSWIANVSALAGHYERVVHIHDRIEDQ